MISYFIATILKEITPNLELIAPKFTSFHVASLIIFLLAILHTLFANKFTQLAYFVKEKRLFKSKGKKKTKISTEDGFKDKSFLAESLFFLGEVEVIFGIWVIPLFITIALFYNWESAIGYLDSRSYVEPIFVVIIMCVASTRPIVNLVEKILSFFAKSFGNSIASWWIVILSLGPIFGSFITEVGAMTLSAVLLAKKFYEYEPSPKLCYATLGLLFVNISIGGLFTTFSAPPVLIIADQWNWNSLFMLKYFGWKIILGLLISNSLYFLYFRKELKTLQKLQEKKSHHPQDEYEKDHRPIPIWITGLHIIMLIWIVLIQHHPVLFLGSFLLFLGFMHATSPHQYALNLKRPLLVGFFLAGLIIHGGLQGWWIIPILGKMQETTLMVSALILTAFNDNASVTYLTSLMPNLPPSFRHAIVSGVMVGGGLTVIANAPNPAGMALLSKYFPRGISFLYLFLSALLPTIIYFLIFYFGLESYVR